MNAILDVTILGVAYETLFETNSLLLQYEILEKLVTDIEGHVYI